MGAKLQVVVVTGFYRQRVESVLSPYRTLSFAYNKEYETGQFSSAKRGVEMIPPTEDFFVALGDMPLIRSHHYQELMDSFSQETDGIRPVVAGTIGHPVLLAKRVIPAILRANPHGRMKELLASLTISQYESADTSFITDVDTPSALQSLIRR